MVSYTSISQQGASLEEREQYFRTLEDRDRKPSVLLQTCNRIELYYGEGEVPDEVARHLFRVTAGLESSLIGERAIQGQVKQFYMDAATRFHLPAEIHKLFTYALQAGKRVRTETEISRGAVSHSLAAIEVIASEHVDLTGSNITIIGVNKLTSDILKFLKNKGARTIFLANRSESKAHQLADPLGIQVCPLRDKKFFLKDTDILISATSAPHTIIHEADIGKERALLAIDLAFPRDIEAAVGALQNVKLYNLDDIEKRVQTNISVRNSEVKRAEAIIEEEITELQETLLRRRQYLSKAV